MGNYKLQIQWWHTVISDTVIQQCQMKIMTTNRESDIERFNLLYYISISKVYWRDLVACIHVSEADSDKSTWFFFFFNCQISCHSELQKCTLNSKWNQQFLFCWITGLLQFLFKKYFSNVEKEAFFIKTINLGQTWEQAESYLLPIAVSTLVLHMRRTRYLEQSYWGAKLHRFPSRK